jgi:hypothetical protein
MGINNYASSDEFSNCSVDWMPNNILHRYKGSFTLQPEPSRAEPERTKLNWAKRVTIHTASRADPNWKQCIWHFLTARMSNQVHAFSLMDNIWWRSLLFTRKRCFWVHNISSRRESFGKFHNLLNDLLKTKKGFGGTSERAQTHLSIF